MQVTWITPEGGEYTIEVGERDKIGDTLQRLTVLYPELADYEWEVGFNGLSIPKDWTFEMLQQNYGWRGEPLELIAFGGTTPTAKLSFLAQSSERKAHPEYYDEDGFMAEEETFHPAKDTSLEDLESTQPDFDSGTLSGSGALLPPTEQAPPQESAKKRMARHSMEETTPLEKVTYSEEFEQDTEEELSSLASLAPPAPAVPVLSDSAPIPEAVGAVPPAPEEKTSPTTEAPLKRKATVRYYSQMHPSQNFPLLVVLSEEDIQQIKLEGVQQVTSKKAFLVDRKKPIVEILPYFPGCICTPARIQVDVTAKKVEARMWITPLCEGDLQDARVEIWHEGKKISEVATPAKVTTQTTAKVMGTLSFVAPLVSSTMQAFGLDPEQQIREGFPLIRTLFRLLSSSSATLLLLIIFAALAVYFYYQNRPSESDPIVTFFSVEEQKHDKG